MYLQYNYNFLTFQALYTIKLINIICIFQLYFIIMRFYNRSIQELPIFCYCLLQELKVQEQFWVYMNGILKNWKILPAPSEKTYLHSFCISSIVKTVSNAIYKTLYPCIGFHEGLSKTPFKIIFYSFCLKSQLKKWTIQ